jgi:hypothetical protein
MFCRWGVARGCYAVLRSPMSVASPDVTLKIVPEEVLEHLETVLASPVFASSKRCQDFLRYVVLESTQGRGHLIKERIIAHEVFGRGLSFEPNEDALVRVKAREVRKRLVDYYKSSPESSIRIDLPLGGYAPHIYSSHEPVTSTGAHDTEKDLSVKQFSRRKFAWVLGGSIATLGIASLVPLFNHSNSPLGLLWQPVFATKTPLLIFIPILYDDDGELSVKIGIGPAGALSSAVDFLVKHNHPYDLRFGSDLTFPQMRKQPTLLLGSFASVWTMRLTRDLRFTLTWDDVKEKVILDKTNGQMWKPVNVNPHGYPDQDYGMLCRLFDAASGQIVMIAAGITTFGTAGAAGLFFDQEWFSELLRQAPKDWRTKSFQAVVKFSIIGVTASSPQVVATHFW